MEPDEFVAQYAFYNSILLQKGIQEEAWLSQS
jgi:hypothetical protein